MFLERSFSSILNIDKYKCFTVKKKEEIRRAARGSVSCFLLCSCKSSGSLNLCCRSVAGLGLPTRLGRFLNYQ